MNYFLLEPDVAGQLGPHTQLDRSRHPPSVTNLHYQFDDWMGDVLVESFPCFLLTEHAAAALTKADCNGFALASAEITTSPDFPDLSQARSLPKFVWMKVFGQPGRDDVGITADARLVVSARSFDVLSAMGIPNARATAWSGDKS